MLAEAAKRMRLPYARFRAVFVEGSLDYGGGMAGEPQARLAMQPVWLSVGDYDNLVAVRKLCHKGDQPVNPDLFRARAQPAEPGRGGGNRYDPDDDSGFIKRFALRVAGGKPAAATAAAGPVCAPADIADVIAYVEMQPDGGYGEGAAFCPQPPTELPGGGDPGPAGQPPGRLFHLDSSGATCFTAAEAAAACASLEASGFAGQLQARLNATPLRLTQVYREFEGGFCTRKCTATATSSSCPASCGWLARFRPRSEGGGLVGSCVCGVSGARMGRVMGVGVGVLGVRARGAACGVFGWAFHWGGGIRGAPHSFWGRRQRRSAPCATQPCAVAAQAVLQPILRPRSPSSLQRSGEEGKSGL